MRCIKAISKGAQNAIVDALLLKQDWIICVTSEVPDDPSTYIMENVTRLEVTGHFASLMKNPVFIEYGISPAGNDTKYPYRIHDSLMTPVISREMLTDLVGAMIQTFDVFIIEDKMVDRSNVYGKLLTDHAEEIVFINEIRNHKDYAR